MLNIEVIKFEAQDIITASGEPAAPKCICDGTGTHILGPDGKHYMNLNGQNIPCPANDHVK